MKKLVITFFLTVVLLIILSFDTSANECNVIRNNNNGIPDKILYQEILKTLDKKVTQTFTKSEAEGITELYIDCYGEKRNVIKSFRGIKYLKNLKLLSVKNCHLKEMKDIEPLPCLEDLNLSYNDLKKIDFVKLYPNLKWLNVMENQLNSLKGVENLTKLTMLDIDYNRLTNIKELKNCHNLTELSANVNFIKNLKGVENLKNLTYLSINSNQVKSLAALKKLNKIHTIRATNNRLNSLKGIEKLKKLNFLEVGGNQLKSINEVSNLKKLIQLEFQNNLIKKLPNLKKFRGSILEFAYNFLNEEEIRENISLELLEEKENQIKLQNIDCTVKLIKPKSIKNITTNTVRIEGQISLKGKPVRLECNYGFEDGNTTIKKTITDANGRFVFDNLNLKKKGGCQLSIEIGGEKIYFVEVLRFTVLKK